MSRRKSSFPVVVSFSSRLPFTRRTFTGFSFLGVVEKSGTFYGWAGKMPQSILDLIVFFLFHACFKIQKIILEIEAFTKTFF